MSFWDDVLTVTTGGLSNVVKGGEGQGASILTGGLSDILKGDEKKSRSQLAAVQLDSATINDFMGSAAAMALSERQRKLLAGGKIYQNGGKFTTRRYGDWIGYDAELAEPSSNLFGDMTDEDVTAAVKAYQDWQTKQATDNQNFLGLQAAYRGSQGRDALTFSGDENLPDVGVGIIPDRQRRTGGINIGIGARI